MENKDPDTVSLHGSSDIDGNIEKLINSSSESDESPSEDDLDIQKLRSELLEDDEIGPPVSKDLAELFQKLKESGLSKEKVASKAKEYPKPANCDLETKQVNPEIWSGIITTKERSADLQLQKGQKLISKASYAILKVTQSAISANKDKKRRKESIKNIIKASTDALAFISTAHLHTEKLRRELLLKKLSYDQRSIGKDVPANDKLLFGDNLNKRLAEAAGVSKLKPRKFSQSYSQGYSQPSSSTYTKRFQKNNYSKNEYRPQKSSRGRRGGFQRSTVKVSSDTFLNFSKIELNILKDEVANYRGGDIKKCIEEWYPITKDKFILDIVKQGLKLEFENDIPKQNSYPHTKYSHEENEILKLEVQKLIKKGIVQRCEREDGDFISTLFTRPKKDGNLRMILNLKPFNKFIKYKHFKMESIETAINCMKPGIYMGSVDLKDAFFSIPMYEPHQKYLKFVFNNICYKFICMPMGYGPSMRIFTKVLKPIYAFLRNRMFESAVYVDDNLLFGGSMAECDNNIWATTNLLRNLGFTIHAEKSILLPTQKIIFLGFILNSLNMTITLTDTKKEKIIMLCQDAIKNPTLSIRKLSCIIGNIVASFPAVPYGKLHYRSLEKFKVRSLRCNEGNFDQYVTITEPVISELSWWIRNIGSAYKNISETEISKTIYTDASRLGWGIFSNNISNGGKWDHKEQELHINALELLAIKYGIKAFCHKTNLHIKIMCDNSTAIAYIKNMGGMQSNICNKIAKDIWDWCEYRSIWITPTFIPGKLNVDADNASRLFNDATEWMLSTNVFNSITKNFGLPEIDLFASISNKQLNKYVAWKPDPEAIAIDAFTISWGKSFSYIFPPFSVLGKVMKKIQEDKAKCILISPEWPTQPWYATMLKLASRRIIFKPANGLLTLPSNLESKHPLAEKLSLGATLINCQSVSLTNYHTEVRIF